MYGTASIFNNRFWSIGLFSAVVLGWGALGCETGDESYGRTQTAKQMGALEEATGFADGSYELLQVDEPDPLWRFHKDGTSMRFETDPTITSWGTDYWGYWSDPFELADNAVEYVIGLTRATYEFAVLSDGTVDVTKTLVVQPYLGGSPTTTVTHLGIYARTGDTGSEPEDTDDESDTGGEIQGDPVAELRIINQWRRSYCASIEITNEANASTETWSVTIDTNGGRITSNWNAVFDTENGMVVVTPLPENAAIAPGETESSSGFCVRRRGGQGAEIVSVSAEF